jgi:DNA-binding CsgD family transcriptional regulator
VGGHDAARLGAAQHHFAESSDLYRQLGDQVLYALGLCDVGWAISRGPDPALALGYLRQALAICERLGDPSGIAWATYNLGEVLFVLGRDAEAEPIVLDGQRQLTRLGIGYGVYISQVTLGHAYRRQARWTAAIEAYLGAVRAQQHYLQRTHGVDVLAGLGVVALALDRPDCAARLFGACRAWADTYSDMSLLNPSRDLLGPRADADNRLGDPEWAEHYEDARRMTTEQALTMAAADAEELLRQCTLPLPLGLSEREMEVMRLVALGLTDSAIAERLVLSPRTVQGRLRSVYSKLGVKNRSAAVHRATHVGLLRPE